MKKVLLIFSFLMYFFLMEIHAQDFYVPGNNIVSGLIEGNGLKLNGGSLGHILVNDGTGVAEWQPTSILNINSAVETTFPITGNGSISSPISLSTSGLNSGDGLIWNGSSWVFDPVNHWTLTSNGVYYDDDNTKSVAIGTSSVSSSYKLRVLSSDASRYTGHFQNNSYQTSSLSYQTYALYAINSSNGSNPNGARTGVYSYISNVNGAGNKYAIDARVPQGGSGINYAIKAEAEGTNNYAGHFRGNVLVTTLSGSGNRAVYADSNGKLITGSAGSSSLWTESGSNVYRSSGKVGIGTSSLNNSYTLQVQGSVAAGFYGDIVVTDGSSSADRLFQVYDVGDNGVMEMFDNDQRYIQLWANGESHIDGVLGIGNSNPDDFYNLDVTGRARISSYLYLSSNPIISSDRRIKTNITPIQSALDKVKKLEGVSYFLDTKAMENFGIQHEEQRTSKNLGFIAQDVKEIFPEVVVRNPNNDLHGVQYEALVPVLVEAIKEQQQVIEDLQERVQELENN